MTPDTKDLAARLARECGADLVPDKGGNVGCIVFESRAQLEAFTRRAMVEAYKDALASCEATEKEELRGLDCTKYMRERIKELS